MSSGIAIEPTATQLAEIRYNDQGLVPAIVQDIETRSVLMMAWMTAETLALTFAEGRMVYWSRSRSEIWRKGETSGDVQLVQRASYDCDGDVLLFEVIQTGGGACHTGAYSCFFNDFGAPAATDAAEIER
ncbi:MAG: phosphoribosyl-AMP cyclohydrolase [Actinomycetota bacterium]